MTHYTMTRYYIDVNHPGTVYRGTHALMDKMEGFGGSPFVVDGDRAWDYWEDGRRWPLIDDETGEVLVKGLEMCNRCGCDLLPKNTIAANEGLCTVCTIRILREEVAELKPEAEKPKRLYRVDTTPQHKENPPGVVLTRLNNRGNLYGTYKDDATCWMTPDEASSLACDLQAAVQDLEEEKA